MRIAILGQGIAGTLISRELLQAGAETVVFEQRPDTTASTVASGLWNPVVLKRLTPVWRATDAMEALKSTYTHWENSSTWLNNLPILRAFHTAGEKNQWMELSDNEAVADYLSTTTLPPYPAVVGAHGFGQMVGTGYVNTAVFLNAWNAYLDLSGKLRAEHAAVEANGDGYLVNGEAFDEVVDCRGLALIQEFPEVSGWFSPTKGEVLTVYSPDWPLKEILHGGIFVIPLGNSFYRIGATYQWDQLDSTPTQEGRDKLLREWEKITPLPAQVEDHQAGVRPNVRDRRPLLGQFKPGYWIFNGLGSRGILHGPLCAQWLKNAIMNGSALPKEVDIQRFSAPRFSGA